MTASVALGQEDDGLVGIWVADAGFMTVELLFRSDGEYQVDSIGTDPASDFHLTDRGRYEIAGQSLTLISHQYLDQPVPNLYEFQLVGDSLLLAGAGSDLSRDYQRKPDSRAEVLAREQASPDLLRRWARHILFVGDEEYTFRPGGSYCLKRTHEDGVFPPEFERGRWQQTGKRLTLQPYGVGVAEYQVDVFGSTLTLIVANSWSGSFTSYEEVPGSGAEVAAKTAEAQAFLSDPNWQVGLWEIQREDNAIELTLRPDGVYSATNTINSLTRVLRGRCTLADGKIHLVPFVGQPTVTLDDANFGMVEQTYTLDYYDGELQLIDLKGILSSVTLAYKRPDTQASVLETVRQALAEQGRAGWYIGIWEVQDPAGWMEFTFRPDNRYIAKSGADGVASEVERGQYLVASGKITLAPYPGNGPARGFELDLYDGNLFLIGDSQRLVIVRKIANSETGVIEKTHDPAASKGERGSILGLWTANRPGESVELIFRQDGQFRLNRCGNNSSTNNTISWDYGMYTVDMATRTLIYDSRLVDLQTQQLDFYGDTMTIYGGLTNTLPSTYTVNLGSVDAAIATSFAADAAEAQVDVQWLDRVLIAPRDPDAIQPPIVDIPSDPDPGQIFNAPTVFSRYQFYRRLIPCFLSVIVNGVVTTIGVIDTQEWHFLPTGRVLVRFRTHRADWSDVIEEVSDIWGAYQIDPRPTETDILHYYADNDLSIRTDLGEQVRLTLENGRRTLFWGKERYLLADWAAEQQPIDCQLPGNADPSLVNTGVSLSTAITPDPIGAPSPLALLITSLAPRTLTVSGTSELACSVVLEWTASLAAPISWAPLRSNTVPAGPFSFTIAQETNTAAFFRVRSQ